MHFEKHWLEMHSVAQELEAGWDPGICQTFLKCKQVLNQGWGVPGMDGLVPAGGGCFPGVCLPADLVAARRGSTALSLSFLGSPPASAVIFGSMERDVRSWCLEIWGVR